MSFVPCPDPAPGDAAGCAAVETVLVPRSRDIGEYFGRELGIPCVTNHWIPDGDKDITVDKLE